MPAIKLILPQLFQRGWECQGDSSNVMRVEVWVSCDWRKIVIGQGRLFRERAANQRCEVCDHIFEERFSLFPRGAARKSSHAIFAGVVDRMRKNQSFRAVLVVRI